MQSAGAAEPSAASLLPTAVVAVAVLALALAVSGVLWKPGSGTIVVQRMRITATTVQNGTTQESPPLSITIITEASAGGQIQRSFTSDSLTRPGFQQAAVGDSIQLYDPLDDTIYVTTERAVRRALLAAVRITAHKGPEVATAAGRTQVVSASSVGYGFGGSGVVGQWLRDGWYRAEGRVSLGGCAALKLVLTQPTRSPVLRHPSGFSSSTIAYVRPGHLEPIETVNDTRLPGLRAISTTRWLAYRVLPRTRSDERLLSLAARHPRARFVRGARAYLRASESEVRTDVVKGG